MMKVNKSNMCVTVVGILLMLTQCVIPEELDGCKESYLEVGAKVTLKTSDKIINIFAEGNYALDGTRTDVVSGTLYVADDLYGCDRDLAYDENLPPWIALVQRGGNCSFEQKSQVAVLLGASAIIIYNDNPEQAPFDMEGIYPNDTAVMISYTDGLDILQSLNHSSHKSVTAHIERTLRARRAWLPDSVGEATSDTVLFVVAGIVCPIAFLFNLIALVVFCRIPDKAKPYLFLIGNLIVTDLFVAILGSVSIIFIYSELLIYTGHLTEYTVIYAPCIADILSELWDISIFSNLLTLLALTIEHFIAFRWPLHHKLVVTKGRILIAICICWLLSVIPVIIAVIEELNADVPECYKQNYCYRLQRHKGNFNGPYSIAWIALLSIVFLVMILVYAFICFIICKVSQRNPGFRKKKTAVLTTFLLVLSFIVSYIFSIVEHCAIVSGNMSILQSVMDLGQSCPNCGLLIDFVVTGMIGAVLDPIIYCVRMKEFKTNVIALCCCTSKIQRTKSLSTCNTSMKAVSSGHPNALSTDDSKL